MRNSKRVQLLAIGLLVWTGIESCGTENPLASRPALGGQSGTGTVIQGQGVLAPAGYEEIRCQAEQPRVVLFIAPPDQVVKKGDLLVELDAFALMEKSEEQQIRVMKAQAELAAAEASAPRARQVAEGMISIAEKALRLAERQLADYRAGEYPTQQVAAMNEARIAEERAMMLKQRSEQLEAAYKAQQSQSLEQELLEVRLASTQAQAEATVARDKLALLKDMIYPRWTQELELAIAQRKLDLLRAQNELERITLEGKTSLMIAQQIHHMEEARSQRLVQQIEACKLYAPRDGTVFSSNDAALGAPCEAGPLPGDMVRPGQVLLRLSDVTQLRLDVRLRFPAAQKIKTGQAATIRVDAFPDRTFRGHIINIRVLKDSDGAGDPTEALVTTRLDDPVKGLRPGLTATAEFDQSNTP